eukprot:283867-Prymnesium_polylepis.1
MKLGCPGPCPRPCRPHVVALPESCRLTGCRYAAASPLRHTAKPTVPQPASAPAPAKSAYADRAR